MTKSSKNQAVMDADFNERLCKQLKKAEIEHVRAKSAAVEAAIADEIQARTALVSELSKIKAELAAERNSDANKMRDEAHKNEIKTKLQQKAAEHKCLLDEAVHAAVEAQQVNSSTLKIYSAPLLECISWHFRQKILFSSSKESGKEF